MTEQNEQTQQWIARLYNLTAADRDVVADVADRRLTTTAARLMLAQQETKIQESLQEIPVEALRNVLEAIVVAAMEEMLALVGDVYGRAAARHYWGALRRRNMAALHALAEARCQKELPLPRTTAQSPGVPA